MSAQKKILIANATARPNLDTAEKNCRLADNTLIVVKKRPEPYGTV